jgi:mannose/fructose/N-acetylgalactosamine-specific phosphotransferase system component IIC
MRLGIMLGALWLALPNRGENVAWGKALPAIFAVIVVLAFTRAKGRILIYAIPIAIVVAILAVFIRPRSKPRPPRR